MPHGVHNPPRQPGNIYWYSLGGDFMIIGFLRGGASRENADSNDIYFCSCQRDDLLRFADYIREHPEPTAPGMVGRKFPPEDE